MCIDQFPGVGYLIVSAEHGNPPSLQGAFAQLQGSFLATLSSTTNIYGFFKVIKYKENIPPGKIMSD